MPSRQLDEEAIFHVGRGLTDLDLRSIYLDQVCADDQALRDRVEALLDIHEKESGFLKSSTEPAPTVDHAPITEGPGQQIARYKLLQKIGEGGFGVVYMAEQQRPVRRKVALKIIKPGMDSHAVVARFEAERQALALMDHPNISRVLDGGATESERPYFVMELVKGVPITEYCDVNTLPTLDRLKLFVTVCQAMQHAHQKGIIHRDLKPSNLLVTLHDGQPVVKVIDFGVAKAINQHLTEKTLFTAYGQMVGTPQYMSPEQAEMSGLDVDTRSDVYALGVLLYELLTGSTPLEGERLRTAGYVDMQRIIREEEPPKPSTRLNESGDRLTVIAKHRSASPERLHRLVRGDLDWIVMKTLEKDRGRRYDTASNLAADISRFLQHEPVAARRPSPAYRMGRFVRRNRGLVAVVTAIVGVLCVGIMGTLIGLFRASHALAELRSVAIDNAITTTLAGDPHQAENAIDLAERTGISQAWLETLRAQVDITTGEYEAAVRRLTRIVETTSHDDETRVAATSLLSIAHLRAGRDPMYIKYVEELSDLRATRAEDHLFMAMAETPQAPSKALSRISEAMRKRKMPVAVLYRATALIDEARETGNYASLQKGLLDLKYAADFVGNTPAIITGNFWAHRIGYELRKERDPDAAEVHLNEAAKSVEQLQRSSQPRIASLFIMQYYDWVDDVEALRRIAKTTDFSDTVFIEYAGAYIFARSTNAADGLDEFESLKFARDNPSAIIARGPFLAEIPNRRHELQRMFESLCARHGESPQVQYRALSLLALTGDAERMRQRARELASEPNAGMRHWGMAEAVRFLAGHISADELLQSVASSRGKQCVARHAIGLQRLAEGDRAGVQEQFAACLETGVWEFFEYAWSKAFLAKMKQDQEWPRWIESRDVPK